MLVTHPSSCSSFSLVGTRSFHHFQSSAPLGNINPVFVLISVPSKSNAAIFTPFGSGDKCTPCSTVSLGFRLRNRNSFFRTDIGAKRGWTKSSQLSVKRGREGGYGPLAGFGSDEEDATEFTSSFCFFVTLT